MAIVKVPYMDFVYFRTASVSVADGKAKVQMPFDWEILEYGGYIGTLGTGAGTRVEVQIRNSSRTPNEDLFETNPTFEVASATSLLEGGLLINTPSGKLGDVLELDIDAVTTGPADLEVWLLCEFVREIIL